MFASRIIPTLILSTMSACIYDPPVHDNEGTSLSSTTSSPTSTSTTHNSPTSTGDPVATTPAAATSLASTSDPSSTSTSVSSTTSDDSDSGGAPPIAPTLTLKFTQIKQFEFAWSEDAGVTSYQLLERIQKDADLEPLGGVIVGASSTSWSMPLHFRYGASYVLRGCNEHDICTDSEPVDVVESMAAAVGYFKASNPDVHDAFGLSIALSSDGNTLAVSAPGESSSATGINGDQASNTGINTGAVYIFVRTVNGWSQQAYVKASNTGSGDGFGSSVALSADGNTLAVGAKNEDSAANGINGNQADDSAFNAGAVYIFLRDREEWKQQAYLKASNPDELDLFGSSVALAEEGGDTLTLAVGAPGESSTAKGIDGDQSNNSADKAGAVYVFTREAGTWSQQSYVKASNPGANHQFGSSVALSATNGNTLAVGAYGEADSAGAVYVYGRDGVWSQQGYLKASNADADDEFGSSVALSADGDTLAVGAPHEASMAQGIKGDQNDDSAEYAGAVYVFVRDQGWKQQTYLKGSNTTTHDRFGSGVSLSASGSILAIGAFGEASTATGINGDQLSCCLAGAGASYVFIRTDNEWSQQAFVKAPNPDTVDSFGWKSVALSADGNTLAVGARQECSKSAGISGDQTNNSLLNAGAVYLF